MREHDAKHRAVNATRTVKLEDRREESREDWAEPESRGDSESARKRKRKLHTHDKRESHGKAKEWVRYIVVLYDVGGMYAESGGGESMLNPGYPMDPVERGRSPKGSVEAVEEGDKL